MVPAFGVTEPRFSPADAGRKSPRIGRRASGDKRERILRAATRVFARKGFYATRVSEVARAAGVADGTIYLYFKSKEDLLTSLFEDRVERLLATVKDTLARIDAPEERLRTLIELQLGVLDGERDLAEVITVSLRQSTRLLRQYAAPKFKQYLETIAAVVADGQARGDFRAEVVPMEAARALFGALDGLALTWALGQAHPGTLRASATQVATLFLRGLSAR